MLAALVRAGVDVVRLNLSHGGIEGHLRNLAMVREVAAEAGRPIGVLADLPGPKIRAGSFPDGGVDLAPGDPIQLVPGTGPSTAHVISVDYPTLLEDVDAGDRVVIGDGGITMRVTGADATSVTAEIESGGRTQGRPGVHISCERLQMFAPTDRDLELAARRDRRRRRVRRVVVRAPGGRRPQAARGHRPSRRHRRQDRDGFCARGAGRDHRGRGCGDGRPR